ncbi:hypothetical protein ABZ897_13335 [Nonomuraea sp. NPDC046802]|uniref:hypothetical protein n=1 Tax=Nonomuraea sp. NPDC046802 TaxID=3154919 RepID=UPI0033C986A9
MRHSRLSAALAALVVLATACTSEKQIVSTPAPVPQPILDSVPYVCKLIPEQAFRLVSGVSGSLVEKTNGNERNGDCAVPETTPQSLGVWWMQEGSGMPQGHLDFLMNGRRNIYTRHGGVMLPADLGDGMAAHVTNNDQPYRVSAKFGCGGKDRLIDIYLAQVAKGRDAIKDMTELMRIAQKRYGKLYNCTPGT